MAQPNSNPNSHAIGAHATAWHPSAATPQTPVKGFEAPPMGLNTAAHPHENAPEGLAALLNRQFSAELARDLQDQPSDRLRRCAIEADHIHDLLTTMLRRLHRPEAATQWQGPPAAPWFSGIRNGSASDQIRGALTCLAEFRRMTLDRVVDRLGRALSREESHAFHGTLDEYATVLATDFTSVQDERLKADTRAFTKYLAFLSHDLRGNLNGALLMIEVMRRELRKDPQFADNLEDLEQMRQSMMEVVQTMDRFLIAERLRQGRVEISLERVGLVEFLREQRDGMSRQRRGSEEIIEVVGDQGLQVKTDREMLSLIVQNLLGNCVKYSDGGMVGMRVFPLANTPDSPIRMEISDTGPGMPQEVKDQLFTPFTRAADRNRGGTGLGLFIAKQAADLIGARIMVESELGTGTLFHVDLPLEAPVQ